MRTTVVVILLVAASVASANAEQPKFRAEDAAYADVGKQFKETKTDTVDEARLMLLSPPEKSRTVDFFGMGKATRARRFSADGVVVWTYGTLRTRERDWPTGHVREIWGEEEIKGTWEPQGAHLRFNEKGQKIWKGNYVDGNLWLEMDEYGKETAHAPPPKD